MYKYIATGIYQSAEGKYRVRKMVNGITISRTVTSKTKALAT